MKGWPSVGSSPARVADGEPVRAVRRRAATVCPVPGCPNTDPCTAHPRDRRGTPDNPAAGRAYRRARAQALRRANHRCEKCGSTSRLQVDHIRRRADGGGHELDNLMVLCKAHHDAKTRTERARSDEVVTTAIETGLVSREEMNAWLG